ncbi:hypothetical protein G0Q06_01265 [Puniceicoccales bacterium CK1056]|uniref:Site-specific recombinase XerD n=1 Tax=Oceanipulchritudo coccoides TaxID=2706888 RepID=A0A6B2LX50_9BACT|nr:hypothetical protein [Oceanipulchritudo coccoides]NDV61071.1 hypothetical protein [Oceanipulchritudo coccoides]
MHERELATRERHTLRKVERKDRKNRWGVEWREDGKRRFQFFSTSDERDKFFRSTHLAGEVEDFSLTEWLRWQSLKRDCEELGIEPEQAVNIARGANLSIATEKSLHDLTEAYQKHVTRAGRSEEYRKHLKSFYGRLEASLGPDTLLLEITKKEIQDFFDAQEVGAVTKRNYRAYTVALFNYAIAEEWLDKSPASRLKIEIPKKQEAGILSVEETRAVLKAARGISPELAGLMALQLFAGLRNANITRLEPSEIDLTNKTILIPAAKFKTGSRHLIEDAGENLWKWLSLSSTEDFCGWTARNYNWRKSQAFKNAKITPPKNALRHSFATYRCALDGSAEKASYILGHQNPREIWTAYKGLATRKDAVKYFNIQPVGVK